MFLDNLFKKGLERSRQTWFSRVKGLFDRQAIDEAVWEELEEILIAADVGVATTGKLVSHVKQRVKDEKLKDAGAVRQALKEEIVKILQVPVSPMTVDRPPRVTLVVGVNGGGKTTSIGKLAAVAGRAGKKVILVAADTFRAAAIEQLQLWGKRTGAEVIAHQPGADPGAVVYDAMQAAGNRHADEVIIDTAGRLHTRTNLMEELKKVRRVISKIDSSAPHEVLLVIDATTGQNGLAQARYFTEATGVTGIFLSKLDGTAKGGIVLAICDELKIPVKYIGVGEKPEDLAEFDAAAFVEALFS